MSETELTLKITNKKGVHARAAAKFVKTVESFNAAVKVAKIAGSGVVSPANEAHEVSGSSILGLMMLGAECNSTLRLRLSGEQAGESAEAITRLIESKFGESE
jgi:phosphocarrier protein